jgi:hypothetical protein
VRQRRPVQNQVSMPNAARIDLEADERSLCEGEPLRHSGRLILALQAASAAWIPWRWHSRWLFGESRQQLARALIPS